MLEEQRRLDEKRQVKRAANRKSASTSRARKKAYVDEMTVKNERMKQHALILSMLPDLVLAVCRSGEMTYVSPSSQWLLLHSPEEILGANIFELVTNDCHPVLRGMISDNLSRPVYSQQTSARKSNNANGSEEESVVSDCEGTRREKNHPRGQLGEHRERFKVAKHSADVARDERRGGVSRIQSPPQLQRPKMLRLIRCDKTTVWCESRLSVRTTTNGGSTNPTPVEIILTLRPELEGRKTSAAHGISRSRVPGLSRLPSSSTQDQDGDASVDDDDGYQCEVDEEDSTNSGSGNDSTRSSTSTKKDRGDGNDATVVGADDAGVKSQANVRSGPVAVCVSAEDGEEPSSTKKRKRVSMNPVEGMTSVVYEFAKSGGEESSTGAESGSSTTQEGGGSSCSNEGDSNGEGSTNSSSKWRGSPRGESRCGEFGGSEDGSTDGSSASGSDLGDDEQSAVQSLILMGGQFGEGSQQ